MNSKELLQLQLSAKRSKPKGAKPDLSNGIAYYAELRRMIAAVTADINKYIMPRVREFAPEYASDSAIELNDSWVDVLTAAMGFVRSRWSSPQFKTFANDTARKFVSAANLSNRKRTEKDIGINVYADQQELADYLQVSISDNARLITSIPDQYLTQVESIVMTNVRAGGRPSAIAKSLAQQFDVTERRAKMIARDQTAKINGDLNRMRQTDAGFPFFQWMDSEDSRVRDRHEYLANHLTAYGKGIYRWDNPPLSDRGVPIIPGSDFQCRCYARPVSQDEVDENRKAGKVAPGVYR
jgi:SPP1 gp7 family putative phage head morphogenesis protein